jgi:formylglycine-generating enzyme required for sulfatase activity
MKNFFSFLFIIFLSTGAHSFENTKIKIGDFFIHKYEVTIQEFQNYADKGSYKTLAETNGGGYEWGVGWEKEMGGIIKRLMAQNHKVF